MMISLREYLCEPCDEALKYQWILLRRITGMILKPVHPSAPERTWTSARSAASLSRRRRTRQYAWPARRAPHPRTRHDAWPACRADPACSMVHGLPIAPAPHAAWCTACPWRRPRMWHGAWPARRTNATFNMMHSPITSREGMLSHTTHTTHVTRLHSGAFLSDAPG
eukprot:364898-Chlamydomonas_euryale.AAC.1